MSEQTFTPGPWTVKSPARIESPTSGLIASVRGALDEQETHANAALIAEAPAMVEAMRKIAQEADSFAFNSDADAFRFVDGVAAIVRPILARIEGGN